MKNMEKLRVLILCGGPSAEHEVSLRTGNMVFEHLDRKKYSPTIFAIKKEQPIAVAEILKKAKKSDFVFIAMHGAFGEDGRMQALLELIGLPYGGSGVASSAMAMDKNIANMLYFAQGFSVPEWGIVDESSIKKRLPFPFPVVAKPVDGGSSVGVSILKTRGDVQKIRGRMMIQEYIKGREFTCGVIEDARGKSFALPPTEIVPNDTTFYDYRAKYAEGGSLHIMPPKLSKGKIKILQQLALEAHEILGCSGMSRSDFILRGSKFYILETNTIPGMTQTSLLPQMAAAIGITFPKLLDSIIQAGFRRKTLFSPGKRIIEV